MDSFKNNPQNPVGILFAKRHIQIHRAAVATDLVKAKLYSRARISDNLTVKAYNRKGELIGESNSAPSSQEQSPLPRSRVKWYFRDHDNEPILALCEKALTELRAFVEETHGHFSSS